MGTLLEKIQKQKAADSADLRKAIRGKGFQSANRAESLRKRKAATEKSANPQTVRTPKPLPRKEIRKSANPHGVLNDFDNNHPENIRNKIRALGNNKQSELVRLAIQSGVFDHGLQLEEKEIAALVPPSDWTDTEQCTIEELKAWAAALAMRAVRYRGKVPAGWDKVANCAHCGPVYSFHNLDTLSCGWCDMRLAGKRFPVPDKPKKEGRI